MQVWLCWGRYLFSLRDAGYNSRMATEVLPALEGYHRQGVSLIQAIILEAARSHGGRGIEVSELRQRLSLASPAMSNHLSRLLRMGLITVVQDEVDQRTRRVVATGPGGAVPPPELRQ